MFSLMRAAPAADGGDASRASTLCLIDAASDCKEDPLLAEHGGSAKAAHAATDISLSMASPETIVRKRRALY